jgi:hypothetical protein
VELFPLPHTYLWHGAQLIKHRDNVTFYLDVSMHGTFDFN